MSIESIGSIGHVHWTSEMDPVDPLDPLNTIGQFYRWTSCLMVGHWTCPLNMMDPMDPLDKIHNSCDPFTQINRNFEKGDVKNSKFYCLGVRSICITTAIFTEKIPTSYMYTSKCTDWISTHFRQISVQFWDLKP